MNRSVLVGWLVLMALAPSSSLEAQRPSQSKVGVDGLVLFRGEGSMAVLARATEFWQPVQTPTEGLRGDFKYLPELATARARGQIFELLDSDAPGSVVGPEGRFVVVPWSFGPGCAEEGWQTPEWVLPGDTVAFLLFFTRARSPDGEGFPVFDIMGWHQPYPVGELIPFWRKSPQLNPVWLSAGEFYELLTVLPSDAAFRTDPQGAVQRFQDWVRGRPEREASFPVPEIQAGWAEARGKRASVS